MARNDPLRNFRYRLEIDSVTQAGFSEVSIAETTIDAVDYREGTDPPHVRKLSGLTKYGNITLKWGLTVGANALDLFKWHSDVSAGQVKEKRKKVTLTHKAGALPHTDGPMKEMFLRIARECPPAPSVPSMTVIPGFRLR